MRKILLRSLILSLILFVFSFGLSYADIEEYVSGDFGFSIIPPEGWEVIDGKPYNIAVIFVGPVDSGFRANFNVNVVDAPEGITEFDEELIEDMKQVLEIAVKNNFGGNIEFIFEGEKEFSIYKGYEIVYIIELEKGLFLEQKQVYLINDGKAYIFTFTSLKETFEKYLPYFEESLESFEIF
ncbi:MAG: hypothetical protein ACK4SU_05335 [Dictyoglomus sp.]